MKKFLLGRLLIVGGLFIVSPEAYADEQANTSVEYKLESSYELIIPAKVTLDTEKDTLLAIKTKNRNISPDQKVDVTLIDGLSNDGEISLIRTSTSDELTSTIKVNDQSVTTTDNIVASFSGMVEGEKEVSTLLIGEPTGNQLAGSYMSILTFSAQYVSI